jgi:EmrB/QacA subfamily drug resistance transporter
MTEQLLSAERVRLFRGRSMSYAWAVGVMSVSSTFISLIDSTVVNVALPTLGRDFHATTASVQWVIIGYLLSLAVVIPACGYLGDRFGTKRMFLFAIAIFTIASLLCATATSLAQLVAYRILQGVGGGMLNPLAVAMMLRAFAPEQRVRASRILMLPTVIGPSTGPVLGGILVTELSWRYAFLINLPFGLAAFAFGTYALREHREPPPEHFDLAGFLLVGSGLPLLLYALSEGPLIGWRQASVIVTAVAGVVLLIAFGWRELRIDDPMLELRLLSDRMFCRANIVGFFGGGAFIATLFLAPLFVQEARGYDAFQSGLATFPEALGVLASTQLVAKLYPIIGPRKLISGGLCFVTAMLVCFSLCSSATNLWIVRLLMFGIGAGMATQIIGLQAAAYAGIPPSKNGHASAIFATQNRVGSALSIAILGTVLTAASGGRVLASAHAFHVVFVVNAAIALVGALLALRIRDVDAARTMAREERTVLAGSGEIAEQGAR